jgi:hypothetical protein
MQALSKLTCGLIPAPYRDSHNATQGAAPRADLMSGLERRSAHLRKQDQMPNVCYGLALHAGVAGNTISPRAEAMTMATAKRGDNYSPEYQNIMGITANNDSATFSADHIRESGVLNFRDVQSGQLVHTAYLHKDPEGGLTLLHNNSTELDRAMMHAGENPIQQGGLTAYAGTVGLQNYLNAGHRFHFTPASVLNQNAM